MSCVFGIYHRSHPHQAAAAAAMDDTIETRLAHKRLFADFLSWEDTDGWKLSDQMKDELADRDHKTNNIIKVLGNR
jgi:hypothetical protein